MRPLFFALLLLTVSNRFSNARYHLTTGLLNRLLHEDDIYFENNSNEPYLSAEDIPKNGEIFEGDIIMDEDLRGAVLGQGKRSAIKNSVNGAERHWPLGIVPYVLDKSLNPVVKEQILKAIDEFKKCTCVKFVPRNGEDDYVVFKDGSGCSSSVGRKGGEQDIHLAYGCKRIGTVMHEMMHALGIIHEQSRSDRDDFIKINYGSIKKDLMHNFRKYSYLESDNLDVPYNYYSVMHYSNYAFSNDGEKTIESKVDPSLKFGQRKQLTHYDLLQIDKLYPCPDERVKCFKKTSGIKLVKDMTAEDVLRRKKKDEEEDMLKRWLEKFRN